MIRFRIAYAALAALVLTACESGQNPVPEPGIAGIWKQRFTTFEISSVPFSNPDGVDTRNRYTGGDFLDSNSCHPAYSRMDTNTARRGSWEFTEEGAYTQGYFFLVTIPALGYTGPMEYDSSKRSGEYELKGDSLKIILNRIGGMSAWTLRTLEWNPSRDSLRIVREDAAYVTGHCAIRMVEVEHLVRAP